MSKEVDMVKGQELKGLCTACRRDHRVTNGPLADLLIVRLSQLSFSPPCPRPAETQQLSKMLS